jgi:hypothetical protein
MPSKNESPAEPGPAKRGDAAWKAVKAEIAGRNDQVRKEGKQRREAYQRGKEHRRHDQDRREQARLADTRQPRSR